MLYHVQFQKLKKKTVCCPSLVRIPNDAAFGYRKWHFPGKILQALFAKACYLTSSLHKTLFCYTWWELEVREDTGTQVIQHLVLQKHWALSDVVLIDWHPPNTKKYYRFAYWVVQELHFRSSFKTCWKTVFQMSLTCVWRRWPSIELSHEDHGRLKHIGSSRNSVGQQPKQDPCTVTSRSQLENHAQGLQVTVEHISALQVPKEPLEDHMLCKCSWLHQDLYSSL